MNVRICALTRRGLDARRAGHRRPKQQNPLGGIGVIACSRSLAAECAGVLEHDVAGPVEGGVEHDARTRFADEPQSASSRWRSAGFVPQISSTSQFGDGCSLHVLKGCSRCDTKRLRGGAVDSRATFSRQSGSSSVESTLLSDPCPPGWLIFSENLSNEIMSPKQLCDADDVMLARFEDAYS